ncbi:MAG: alpha/beta fold hydrolase [Xanthobacteraceae bacterium]|uniref:alpha/beta fold hydrolase n=1 Tax=Pseudolabrys sp. TaxID=1960880 RepID=UPI003D0F4FCA
MTRSGPVSHLISAPDGLRLHARVYGGGADRATPVVCLPGLTRNGSDFEALATALASDATQPRRVIAVDLRGRGLSEYDRDPANYNLQTELADVLAVMAALDASPAVIVGTSRGGLIAMLMAAVRPAAIAGAVLNDIGPAIEAKGLMRIKGYAGKLPQPKDYPDAVAILRRLMSAQFPNLSDQEWLTYARGTFRQDGGRLVPAYDVRLSETLKAVTPDAALPTMWPQFAALAQQPLMVIRGGLSDILLPATVEQMKTRQPEIEVRVVEDQGHAPLLADTATIGAIAAFVAPLRGGL